MPNNVFIHFYDHNSSFLFVSEILFNITNLWFSEFNSLPLLYWEERFPRNIWLNTWYWFLSISEWMQSISKQTYTTCMLYYEKSEIGQNDTEGKSTIFSSLFLDQQNQCYNYPPLHRLMYKLSTDWHNLSSQVTNWLLIVSCYDVRN